MTTPIWVDLLNRLEQATSGEEVVNKTGIIKFRSWMITARNKDLSEFVRLF